MEHTVEGATDTGGDLDFITDDALRYYPLVQQKVGRRYTKGECHQKESIPAGKAT
jgi:hypothetical protein